MPYLCGGKPAWLVVDRALPAGVAYLIGMPYEDWLHENCREASAGSFEEWLRACVRRIDNSDIVAAD